MLSQPLLFMPQFHGSPFLCTISQVYPIKVEVQLVLIFRGHPVPTASSSSFFVLCWSQLAIKSITATSYTEYVATIYDSIICILLICDYYFNFEYHGHNYKHIPTPMKSNPQFSRHRLNWYYMSLKIFISGNKYCVQKTPNTSTPGISERRKPGSVMDSEIQCLMTGKMILSSPLLHLLSNI